MSNIPNWIFDWTGSIFVVISLTYLWKKKTGYWAWSNLSTLPYFFLFLSNQQWLLAGLQISYLIFGLHGQCLWWLEKRRDSHDRPFNEPIWYNLGWVMSLAIVFYAASITDFAQQSNWLQFCITALSLLANWGTTRKWTWSWPVWIGVNCLQIHYFLDLELWGLVALQFALIGMSIRGWMEWLKAARPSGLALRS